jgi:site-specific DNA-methyltransferase (adenine-specific)
LEEVLAGRATWTILHGDVRELAAQFPENTFDLCVCDPPYHLTSVSRNGSPRTNDPEKPHGRHNIGSKGFMGKTWDGGSVTFDTATWEPTLRALKPGAHLFAFGGTRTYHRIACAIEDAGFEIRDKFEWIFGSGFPKSLNVSKAIDETDFRAWLKAHPPERELHRRASAREKKLRALGKASRGRKLKKRIGDMLRRRAGLLRQVTGSYVASGNAGTPTDEKGGTYGVAVENSEAIELFTTRGATEESRKWDGYGTALKPGHEPIALARKPLEGTVVENVRRWGTGALNIGATRLRTATSPRENHPFPAGSLEAAAAEMVLAVEREGRWPPNVVFTHDARCVRRGNAEVPANPKWDTPNRDTEPSAFTSSEVSKVRHANRRDGEPSADKRYADKGATSFAPLPGARRDDTESVDVWECVEGCPVLELSRQSGESSSGTHARAGKAMLGIMNDDGYEPPGRVTHGHDESGTASRYFPQFEWTEIDDLTPFLYCPKANRRERDAGCDHFKPRRGWSDGEVEDGARNNHPTIKPIKLIRWLMRMGARPGSLVLVLFAGAGSEMVAAVLEGFRVVGIELLDTDDEPHASLARARLHHVEGREFVPRESLRAAEPPKQRSLFQEVSS